MDRRCWGFTAIHRRCQRRGAWLFFCHDHAHQPWTVWPLAALTVVASIVSIAPLLRRLYSPPCALTGTVKADVVTRLYGRHDILGPDDSNDIPFTFQEVFYEWELSIASDRTVADALVTVDDTVPDDQIVTEPEQYYISGPSPRWLSGFPEAGRLRPDSYSRTLRIERMRPDTAVHIRLRRPLTQPESSLGGPLVHVGIVAPGCRVSVRTQTGADAADDLLHRAGKLIRGVRSTNAPTIPVRVTSSDLATCEAEGIIEARCKDDTCDQFDVARLEGRIGGSLDYCALLRRYESCDRSAAELRAVLGCVDGPYCAPNEGAECEFGACGEAALEQVQVERLRSLVEHWGGQLDVR